jgi:xanthine dehydrogenase accessory factor
MNLYAELSEALSSDEPVALATVVQATGSTPREAGAKMLVYADGRTRGTIGGGKMEALAIRDAQSAIERGTSGLYHYALQDAQAGDAGICGGQVDVFIDVVAAPPTLVVAGAGHVAMPVAEIGRLCGFRTVVVDDRADMASAERFPHAERRIAPDLVGALDELTITPQTYIVIVTRGHALDEGALRAVIASPAAYIGMIGSRRKVNATFERLRAQGIEEALLSRVRSPIGLDIGAQTPAEIAVSIMSEIILLRRGGSGQPMKLEP